MNFENLVRLILEKHKEKIPAFDGEREVYGYLAFLECFFERWEDAYIQHYWDGPVNVKRPSKILVSRFSTKEEFIKHIKPYCKDVNIRIASNWLKNEIPSTLEGEYRIYVNQDYREGAGMLDIWFGFEPDRVKQVVNDLNSNDSTGLEDLF